MYEVWNGYLLQICVSMPNLKIIFGKNIRENIYGYQIIYYVCRNCRKYSAIPSMADQKPDTDNTQWLQHPCSLINNADLECQNTTQLDLYTIYIDTYICHGCTVHILDDEEVDELKYSVHRITLLCSLNTLSDSHVAPLIIIIPWEAASALRNKLRKDMVVYHIFRKCLYMIYKTKQGIGTKWNSTRMWGRMLARLSLEEETEVGR